MTDGPFQPTPDCPVPPFVRFNVSKLVPNCFLEAPPPPLWESELLNIPVPMIPLIGFGCNCPRIAANVHIIDECECSSLHPSLSSSLECDCLFWDEDAYWEFLASEDDWQTAPPIPTGDHDVYTQLMGAALGGCGWHYRVAGKFGLATLLLGVPADQWLAGNSLAVSAWNGSNAAGKWVVPPATIADGPQPGRWGYFETSTPFGCAAETTGVLAIAWWEAEASRQFNRNPVMIGEAICHPNDPCDFTIKLDLWLPDDLRGPPGPKTAIVEIGGKRKEYVGLFCTEAPEVRFNDQLNDINIDGSDKAVILLDKTFIEVCEPESVEVTSIVCSQPVAASGTIVGDEIHVKLEKPMTGKINVQITGIRKGMDGIRFPKFTKKQKEQNDAFWDQARGEPVDRKLKS